MKLKHLKKKLPVKKAVSPTSPKTSTASKTATSTKTATATKTSTDANTQGNITVTGGAGAGATVVHIGFPGGMPGNQAGKGNSTKIPKGNKFAKHLGVK